MNKINYVLQETVPQISIKTQGINIELLIQ